MQKYSSFFLLVLCLLLIVLCIKEKQKQASLQNEISRLSSESKQETPASSPSTPSVSSSSSTIKQSTSNQDKELKKIQRRNNSNNQKLLEDNQRIMSSSAPKDITIDELKEKDPKAYALFIESLRATWQGYAESRNAKARLLASLNPDYLSPEDLELFRNELQRRIRNDEYALAFQRKPLPNGLYYGPHGEICSDGNRSDKDEIPSRIDVNDLIIKYCSNAAGLDYSLVKELDKLKYCIYPQGPMRIMPYFMEFPKGQ